MKFTTLHTKEQRVCSAISWSLVVGGRATLLVLLGLFSRKPPPFPSLCTVRMGGVGSCSPLVCLKSDSHCWSEADELMNLAAKISPTGSLYFLFCLRQQVNSCVPGCVHKKEQTQGLSVVLEQPAHQQRYLNHNDCPTTNQHKPW